MNAKCLIWALALLTMVSVISPTIAADYAQEQVMSLPEDGNVWATLVFTTDAWQTNPTERKVVAWFSSNNKLASLVAQTKFHHYTASSLIYKHKFASVVQNQFPCIIVQTFDGKKAYKISGANMPSSGEDLAAAIDNKLKTIQVVTKASTLVAYREVYNDGCNQDQKHGRLLRPRPVCPGPDCPTPAPVVQPAPVAVNVAPVLDDKPAPPEHAEEPKLGLVAVLFGVGALAAVGVMLHKAVN